MQPLYQQMQLIKEGAAKLGIPDPYFRAHQGVAGGTAVIPAAPTAASISYVAICCNM